MYTPKAVDFVTSNDKHIMIYEHLDYPFTIKLSNDLVVAVDPKSDEVVFLIPDDNEIYNVLTDITSRKPSACEAELFIRLNDLFKYEELSKGEVINTKHISKMDSDFINYHFAHKSSFESGRD